MESKPYKDNSSTSRPKSAPQTDTDPLVPINPRRKFRRRGTGDHSDYRESESEDEDKSIMSDSSEHEMDAFDSDDDLDVESGLPTEERRKFLRKQRKRNNIDSRIAGMSGKLSQAEKKEADKNVIQNLTTNAILIGLWYFFSLSISLVSILNQHTFSLANISRSTTNGCSPPTI